MKRHKYKFRKELLSKSERSERHHVLLSFLKSQQISFPLSTASAYLIMNYYESRSRVILYCLVTGRVRSTLSITNTSRHVFFWSVDHAYITGFIMTSW